MFLKQESRVAIRCERDAAACMLGKRGIMDLDDAIGVYDVLFEQCQSIEIDAGAIVSVQTTQLASRRRESARLIKPPFLALERVVSRQVEDKSLDGVRTLYSGEGDCNRASEVH